MSEPYDAEDLDAMLARMRTWAECNEVADRLGADLDLVRFRHLNVSWWRRLARALRRGAR